MIISVFEQVENFKEHCFKDLIISFTWFADGLEY